MRIIVLIVLVIISKSRAGFCDTKTDGYHCDQENSFGGLRWVVKHCVDGNKQSETFCPIDYKCSFGRCRAPAFCEVQKTLSVQDLFWCQGIVTYSVDKNTNGPAGDSNAKTYSELLKSYEATLTNPPVVNGTTEVQTTTPAPPFSCDEAYKRFGCFRAFIPCSDRYRRQICKDECAKVNQCISEGNQVDCDAQCGSAAIIGLATPLLLVLLLFSVVI